MDYIYFDNAASTPLRSEVKEYMIELMDLAYGNPSSTHAQGRKAKVVLESSRKSIAKHLNCLPAELVFCSGGTEGDNAAIAIAIADLGVNIRDWYGTAIAFMLSNSEQKPCSFKLY